MTTTLSRETTAAKMPPSLPQPATRRTATLTTTLRDRRNLGDLLPLAAHIARHGLRNPVSVSPGGQVIIGPRRLLAASLAGLDVIPARTVTTVQEAVDVVTCERLADQGDPDAAALIELPTIAALAELDAALRELEWWPRESSSAHDTHRRALYGAWDNPDGSRFMNASYYGHARALWLAAHGLRSNAGGPHLRISARDQQAAADALASLDHRQPPVFHSTYTRWRKETTLPPRKARNTTAAARTFSSADVPALLASLRGYTGAVIRTGLPGPDITGEDRATLEPALTELINHLKEIRKGIRP